jgi:hypothetical protein
MSYYKFLEVAQIVFAGGVLSSTFLIVTGRHMLTLVMKFIVNYL